MVVFFLHVSICRWNWVQLNNNQRIMPYSFQKAHFVFFLICLRGNYWVINACVSLVIELFISGHKWLCWPALIIIVHKSNWNATINFHPQLRLTFFIAHYLYFVENNQNQCLIFLFGLKLLFLSLKSLTGKFIANSTC